MIIFGRGKFISPFLLILLSTSLLLSQFEISNWVNPGVVLPDTTRINHMHFYTQNDINFMSRDDSTKVYTSLSGAVIYFPINKALELKMDIEYRQYRTRFVHDLLQIDAYENYKWLNYHKNSL